MTAANPVSEATQARFDSLIQRIAARALSLADLIAAAEELKAAGLRAHVVDLYKTWLAFNADQPYTHAASFNYAMSLSDMGDRAGAVNVLRDTIRMNPEFSPAYINLGTALEALNQKDRAVMAWRSLIDRFPAVDHGAVKYKTMALNQTARVFEAAQTDELAEEALHHSLSINPKQTEALQHWVSLRQRQCKWPVLEAFDDVTVKAQVAGISPLTNACYSDDPMFQLTHGYKYQKNSIGQPATFEPESPDHWLALGAHVAKTGKLRIGYVSSDLRDHAVGFSMTEVVALHDRAKVEVFAYYCGIPGVDTTQTRIRAHVDHWTDINGMDDATAAAKIRADGIHILVDLNGYTKDARTKVFAHKPAPINVNWFGFPNSMGTPYHHYIIGDEHVIPPDQEMFYSERVVRLPCYQPNDRHRIVSNPGPSRADEKLPANAFVFCCLNGMQKLNPETFAAWMEILKGVPNSVLWLLAGTPETNARLAARAEATGLDPARLIFADKRANPDHVARYRLADLFLDTGPYGAHTTAADSLWMGTPILTLKGKTFAARVCAGLLTAAGVPELICTTRSDYIARAIVIGNNPQEAQALRAKLDANRATCLLFDTPNTIRHLEDLYAQMWAEFAAGHRPVPDLTNLDLYHDIALDLDHDAIRQMDATDLQALYKKELMRRHAFAPIPFDTRLWQKNDA